MGTTSIRNKGLWKICTEHSATITTVTKCMDLENDIKKTMTKVLVASLVLCIGACICAVIGTGIPFWIRKEDCNIGLWQTCCRVTISNETDYICYGVTDDDKDWVRAVKSLTVLSPLSLIFSSLFIVLFWMRDPDTIQIRGAILTSALGGLGLITAAVVFGVEKKDFQADFHASFYLTLISGACVLVAALLALIFIGTRGEYSRIRTT